MTIEVPARAPSSSSEPVASRPRSIDLSGRWHLDPGDAGDAGEDGGLPIELPAAWQTIPAAANADVVRLRRTVAIEPDGAERAAPIRWWLHFESVATDVRARVNEVEVGRHVGDWIPFRFDVTEAIGRGLEARLELRIDLVRAAPPEREGDLQSGHVTKGFHDVISRQHGGVWRPCRLERTGTLAAIPDGVAVRADPRTGSVRIVVELEAIPRVGPGRADVEILGVDGAALVRTATPVAPDADRIELAAAVPSPRSWSPEEPNLYTARVELHDAAGLSERHEVRFGFRSVRADGRAILLNDRPLFLRGVLHWGHEPALVAPAPSRETIRGQFARLRAMGFNGVCLCMWYAPRRLYDIADETGMLLWQIHPVWQSRMDDHDLDEYRRLYRAFLRRDRNHPSVIIVSATCEHPAFHPDLAAWWWETSASELPNTLRQLQTAFFKWADPDRTDLHDEHTYENADRWPCYLEDLQQHLESLPPRPFVMGETIVGTSWPDLDGLRERGGDARPWWLPRSFDHMIELESTWRQRYGDDVVRRFRRQGDRFHLRGRAFQVEQFRRFPPHAGLVMNHLRDVPACQCGFLDDLDRWRFEPEQTRPWLADAVLLLLTPEHRRGFTGHGGRELSAHLVLSNFGPNPIDAPAHLSVRRGAREVMLLDTAPLSSQPGAIASVPIEIPRPRVNRPTRLTLGAEIREVTSNAWDLWLFPPRQDAWPAGMCRLDAYQFAADEAEPAEVERGYSRGWGLPARSWRSILPDPARLAPTMPSWDGAGAAPAGTGVVLAHRLTTHLLEWVVTGGAAVLLASKARGGLRARYEWIFGCVPLVIEESPLGAGDSDWIVDLLAYDLVRRTGRVIPVEDLGLADRVDPLIRLVSTHDRKQRVVFFDLLFATRVGEGVLVASALDHHEAPGRWLLRRIIEAMHAGDVRPRASVEPAELHLLTFEAESSR